MNTSSLNDKWRETLLNDSSIVGRRHIAAYPTSWRYIFKKGDKVAPTYELPKLGAQLVKNSVDLLTPCNLRVALQTPWNLLRTEPERKRALDVLNELDEDYTLLKESLRKDPMTAELLIRGYDVLPDLDQGKYVWMYAEEAPKTIITLSQRDGEEGDKQETSCPEAPTLKVDIFYNNKLVKENFDMPLEWESAGLQARGLIFVDLLAAARDATGIPMVGSASVYVEREKPAEEINWDRRTLFTHRWYSCEDVSDLKGLYVAIGLSYIGFSCAICNKEALFGNKHHMETFCSKVCLNSFIQSKRND